MTIVNGPALSAGPTKSFSAWYSFYDCLIIASALQAGCDTLYTEDLQHHPLIKGSLRVVNPFLAVANEVAG